MDILLKTKNHAQHTNIYKLLSVGVNTGKAPIRLYWTRWRDKAW